MQGIKAPFEDLEATCKCYFGVQITPYQLEILEAVLKEKKRKVTIRATTRAGKSYAIAMLAVLYATFQENRSVGILAPTYDKARKLMDYIAELLNSHPIFEENLLLDSEGATRMEKLRKEVSKRRITFKYGCSIEIKSVDLSIKGMAAMGFAYDLNIVEETAEIDDISFTKIHRMLVESPTAQIVEIGNPWFLNHFYMHHNDETWTQIHIDWRQCVAAGRMTQAAVDEQKRELTEIEFQVLFDADFPTELEFSIFTEAAIKDMCEPAPLGLKYDRFVCGIDVARGGRDRTVISFGGIIGNQIHYLKHIVMDTRDTMQIVGQYRLVADAKYGGAKCETTIDTVNNAGVHDRLKELGYSVREFVGGAKARDEDRFFNIKTEAAFLMADVGKAGRIKGLPKATRYTLELRSWIYEVRSDKKLKIVDPEDKSPDYADSLLYMCANNMREPDSGTIIASPIGTLYPGVRSNLSQRHIGLVPHR